jgi:GNAT superfamily N-acetyltransferase
MTNFDCQRDGYTISTDKARLDIDAIHDYLSQESYWAQGRPREVTQTAVEHSLCFGIYAGTVQVGFARVVTDYATFAWLADVFVLELHRGRGLGKWLVECVVNHPDLQSLKFMFLGTRDAHELYRRYGGFQRMTEEMLDRWMIRARIQKGD